MTASLRIVDRIWSSGSACIALASMVYAIAAALVRPIDPKIPILEIVAIRSGLSLVFSYLVFMLKALCSGDTSDNVDSQGGGNRFFGARENFPFLALRGLVGAAAMDMFYGSLRLLSLGDAVSLLFTNPAITAALAAVLLKETLHWPGIVGCLCSLFGMVLVVRPPALFGVTESSRAFESTDIEEPSTNRHLLGSVFGITSAVLAAVAYYAIRLVGRRESSLTIAVWFHVSAFVHSTILLCLHFPHAPAFPGFQDWLCLIGIAGSSFSANILLNRGFQIENAALASAVNYTQVIYAHAIGVVAFDEDLQWIGVGGSVVILLGVMAVAWDSKHHKQAASHLHPSEGLNGQKSGRRRSIGAVTEAELLPLTKQNVEEEVQ